MEHRFIYNEKPVAASRPRVTYKGTYTAKPYREYKEKMKLWASRTFKPMEGAVDIHIYFYMPIPKSLSKKKQDELNGTFHIKKGDIDNYIKSCLDSIDGYAFNDDGQVAQIFANKKYSYTPRTEICIKQLDLDNKVCI